MAETTKTRPIGRSYSAPSTDELNGILDGKIEAGEMIGKGGMGAVYKATQIWLKREVAIKLLLSDGEEYGFDFRDRFLREARAQASLDHPNIVTIHDFGETTNGLFYFSMELVDGNDLHNLIHSEELTEAHVFSWIPQVCKALQFAHDNGLVHRDVKPANIFITSDGRVKVGDFGLVKIRNSTLGSVGVTQLKISIGTREYIAPEAADAKEEVDGRADVYSLGVVLYEMLTGTTPKGAFTPVSRLRDDLHPGFDEIITNALQPEREDRYQSIEEMGKAVAALQHVPKAPPKSRLRSFMPSRISWRRQPTATKKA
ncbi:MAG: serine/threonine protein kinase [Verrucomicrobiales bacterium]|jgi:serine/threonine protein kinase